MDRKTLVGYIRVSTEDQGKSGLGLEAQREAIERFAAISGYELLAVFKDEVSGKLGAEDRPGLKAAMSMADKQKSTLVVSKLDRLSRNAAFILNMMEAKARFVTVQHGFAVDEFTLHLYAVLGEKERKQIGERTKAALDRIKASGRELGNLDSLPIARQNSCANQAAKADDFAERFRPTLERMLAANLSTRQIVHEFNTMGVRTARGGDWSTSTVHNLIKRLNLK